MPDKKIRIVRLDDYVIKAAKAGGAGNLVDRALGLLWDENAGHKLIDKNIHKGQERYVFEV